jgi:hypothetical protein
MSINDNTNLEIIQDENLYPDGGYGWIVLFSTFIVVFLNFSLASTWGIIQEGWNKEFNGNFSQLSLSWVGSILISFAYASGPLNKLLRSFLGFK